MCVLVWVGVDESLCAGMYVYVWMNHCVLVDGCVDESLCVGMGAWMNHCVLVWVCG